tara:strand:+ start:425 stop:547 length:123 start_codon:yes stop_codon:yes gene_type:complete
MVLTDSMDPKVVKVAKDTLDHRVKPEHKDILDLEVLVNML